MDGQTWLVVLIVAAAAFYVGRALWPARETRGGCSSCPQNRHRTDDYV